MARRERKVAITDQGSRDYGKTFVLREMSSDAGEWWAIRSLIVMGNAGVTLPAGVQSAGMEGLAYMEASKGLASALFAIGLRMLPGVNAHDLKPLLDEMMACVQYKPPGNLPLQPLHDGDLCQIEEITTRLKLRAELLELHLGFSLAGAESTTDTTPPAAPAS
jgi:hypothetical protein